VNLVHLVGFITKKQTEKLRRVGQIEYLETKRKNMHTDRYGNISGKKMSRKRSGKETEIQEFTH
jgi:hypothetical protein